MSYITLEVTSDDRRFPSHILVPLRRRESVTHPLFTLDEEMYGIRGMIIRSYEKGGKN